jgi:hypothetical protein
LGQGPQRYADGQYLTPEISPGGIALFDADNDGLLDLLVIRHPPPGPYPEAFNAHASNQLFRQLPDGRFVEVPNAGGLAGRGWHHGVAIGDINNDGFPDIYVCNYGGPDELFLNRGDGTFSDITAKAFPSGFPGSAASRDNWSTAAAFFDYDGDGFLDLVVVHFATFIPSRKCRVNASVLSAEQRARDPDDRDYCGPHTFPGQLVTLWHNNGDGTFTDVTARAGLNVPARGWGVIAADLTGDGLPDIFQANDEEPNQLWVNQGNGKFVDQAVIRGCAFSANGVAQANMGVAIGDVHNDGSLDILITHIAGESSALYHSSGDGLFSDVTATAGMSTIDRAYTGWGCGFLDFDNDGNLDVAACNGRVEKGPLAPGIEVGPFWSRYAEPNLLFRGDGTGRFVDVSAAAGDFASRREVHRGLAFGDLRNRGAIDIVGVNIDNTVRVFRNDAALASANHWLQVLPMLGKREALGARVTLLTGGGHKRVALCLRSYGYLASNDPRVHFGLGAMDRVEGVEIFWPSGSPKRERFAVAAVDRLIVFHQGEGKSLP